MAHPITPREMVRYRKELDDARAARLSVGRNHKKKGKKGKKDKKDKKDKKKCPPSCTGFPGHPYPRVPPAWPPAPHSMQVVTVHPA